ncbi:MAG: toxin-antitoxin system [Propionibacteriaceae bacterium]|nr:toxin-antitoxin system [Propionibacteriaceae bacterium]
MATILIRGIDDRAKEALVARAKANGRSMEAEARAVLEAAVQTPNVGLAILRAFQEVGGLELDFPSRTDEAGTVEFE